MSFRYRNLFAGELVGDLPMRGSESEAPVGSMGAGREPVLIFERLAPFFSYDLPVPIQSLTPGKPDN